MLFLCKPQTQEEKNELYLLRIYDGMRVYVTLKASAVPIAILAGGK